jgi:hypothetical protein
VTLAVKQDETPRPVEGRPLGAVVVMPHPQPVAQPVQQLWRLARARLSIRKNLGRPNGYTKNIRLILKAVVDLDESIWSGLGRLILVGSQGMSNGISNP